jgi:hypothetical protein
MSARKWPFYTMPVGDEKIIPDRKSLLYRVHHYGYMAGKAFMTRRRGGGRLVRRIA